MRDHEFLPQLELIYTAAHGGFAKEAVPLGGGAAVFEQLVAQWQQKAPFRLRTITPEILGQSAPTGRVLVSMAELAYARFCRDFERAATVEILKQDPKHTVVLINDISEGPNFQALAQAGFSLFSIYHVDVLNYVTSIYCRGLISPATAARLYSKIPKPFRPDILGLVFDKQEASVRYSRKLILPSGGMADVMCHTYPWLDREKCVAMPWGVAANQFEEKDIEAETVRLRAQLGISVEAQVLLTLSRISPEKGQDTLLESLQDWVPSRETVLVICGDAAFMMGQRFLQRLQTLASRMKKVRVVFPGYVTGLRKQAFFRLANLYVFPSRHESYGLTMIEAMAAGLPVVCFDHFGAREVMQPRFGEMVRHSAEELREAIVRMLADASRMKRCGEAARTYASQHAFEATAVRLGDLLVRNS